MAGRSGLAGSGIRVTLGITEPRRPESPLPLPTIGYHAPFLFPNYLSKCGGLSFTGSHCRCARQAHCQRVLDNPCISKVLHLT